MTDISIVLTVILSAIAGGLLVWWYDHPGAWTRKDD